jgi:hypothetical protein
VHESGIVVTEGAGDRIFHVEPQGQVSGWMRSINSLDFASRTVNFT